MLIPAAQGLLSYLRHGALTTLIVGEAITAAVILALSVAKFLRCRLVLGGGRIIVTEGVLLRTRSVIPVDKISSTFIRTGPLLRLTGAVEVRLSTEAGRPGKPDFKIIMPRSVAPDLYELFPPDMGEVVQFHPPAKRLIIMAAATSNSATGLLIAAPIISHTGKLLGAGITERVYGTLNEMVAGAENTAGVLIPPIAGYIALTLLIGFGISFFISVFKNLPFKMTRRGNNLTVVAGLIMKRHIRFQISMVNSISITQNPVMMFLRRYNVGISIAGYGSDYKGGETAMIIPAAQSDEVYALCRGLLPNIRPQPLGLRHPACALRKFCTPPALLLGIIPVVAGLLSLWAAHFSDLIWFLALVAEGLDLVFIVICVRKFRRGGLSIGEEFCASGARMFNMVELHCNDDNCGYLRVTEYPWDKRGGLCRVKLSVRSENAESLNIPFLETEAVLQALQNKYGAL
ncbi:MAG: PH domain-containing protein [Candidatus Howiella sp.]